MRSWRKIIEQAKLENAFKMKSLDYMGELSLSMFSKHVLNYVIDGSVIKDKDDVIFISILNIWYHNWYLVKTH